VNLTETLLNQITWHWDRHLRPRLDGLADDEYFWEPVDACWSVRPRGTGTAPIQAGAGDLTMDFAMPEPDPAPVTTIAWRLGHVVVGVLAMRNTSHFGRESTDYEKYVYAGSAAEALEQLDTEYARWIAGCRALGDDRLNEPVGEAEGPFAEHPYVELVLHINRELIHHLAEVSLLRDLYAWRAA
jgi:hypothetical protein